MNKYCLSKHPSSYYRALFSEELVVIEPHCEAGHYLFKRGASVQVPAGTAGSIYFSEVPERGLIAIKVDELEFEVYLESSQSAVYPELLQLAKDVLAQIVEMDTAARALESPFDHEEHLAYIDITRSHIALHYFASTVNTEWSVYFTRDESGTFQIDYLG